MSTTRKITHLCGFFAVKVDSGFINGGDPQKESKSDISMPKFLMYNGNETPYISAQSWRHYWRKIFNQIYRKELNYNPKLQKLENLNFLRQNMIYLDILKVLISLYLVMLWVMLM